MKEKQNKKNRICIYSINAPYQNSDLYVVFYVDMLIIFPSCV